MNKNNICVYGHDWIKKNKYNYKYYNIYYILIYLKQYQDTENMIYIAHLVIYVFVNFYRIFGYFLFKILYFNNLVSFTIQHF